MAKTIVECVPNFSEGRDPAKVDAIADAIRSVAGIVILDRELDIDHNRSVITFVAPKETVSEAALRGAAKAIELIDLTSHTGAHPRIGAVDVLPFVPIEGVTLEDCIAIAERTAKAMWERFKVPCYLYEAAARTPERVNLENIRKGQFEGLREEVRVNTSRKPDFGDAELHPTAGATVVGARKFLIAYNINLATGDVEIAKKIARAIRHSSGGFRYVKSMGVMLHSRGVAQVSMNLTDFEQTPLHRVFETVRTEAARYGTAVVGSEIVGLIPKKALEMTADWFLRIENFRPDLVLENRLAAAAASEPLDQFLDELAAPTATPGGGSASAAAGAMAAALGLMVAGLSKLADPGFAADRTFFSEAVTRDAASYDAVLAAHRKPKDQRAPFVEEALHRAALVPLEVAERARDLAARLEELGSVVPSKFFSDVEVAHSLARAAREGALANVRINLESIQDEAFKAEIAARL